MTRIEYIYNIMKDVTNKTPILLIGNAMYIFKKLYRGHIYHIENTEDAKNIISKFYGVSYEKPIVIEDISFLYRDTILLKLIEDIKLPIILLSTEDNISNTLKSRINTFIKFPNDTVKCEYIKVLDALEYIEQTELKNESLDKYIAEFCPEIARLNYKMKNRKNKDKLLQILGGLYDDKYNKSQC